MEISLFLIRSNPASILNLSKNHTYTFDQSHVSNTNHPIAFKLGSGGEIYTTGVTSIGVPGQPGAFTKIVTSEEHQIYITTAQFMVKEWVIL